MNHDESVNHCEYVCQVGAIQSQNGHCDVKSHRY